VCTVVVRWSPGEPARILALRDELAGRPFDGPGRWWPEFPDAVGGRDRLAGGTWCATRVDTGVSALVLNRPQKRVADPGAPSRGVLPLVAVAHERDWQREIDLAGMASFALVLVTPAAMTTWDFDGEQVQVHQCAEGTHMVTSGGPEDRKAERYLPLFAGAGFPDGWRALVRSAPPADDPGALVVRHAKDDLVYATVFGQLVETAPGRLRLEYSREPWAGGPWTPLEAG